MAYLVDNSYETYQYFTLNDGFASEPLVSGTTADIAVDNTETYVIARGGLLLGTENPTKFISFVAKGVFLDGVEYEFYTYKDEYGTPVSTLATTITGTGQYQEVRFDLNGNWNTNYVATNPNTSVPTANIEIFGKQAPYNQEFTLYFMGWVDKSNDYALESYVDTQIAAAVVAGTSGTDGAAGSSGTSGTSGVDGGSGAVLLGNTGLTGSEYQLPYTYLYQGQDILGAGKPDGWTTTGMALYTKATGDLTNTYNRQLFWGNAAYKNNGVGVGSVCFGGGEGQKSLGTYSATIGGQENATNSDNAFVGGGHSNAANALQSAVVGGYANIANGVNQTVVGKYNSGNTTSLFIVGVGSGTGDRKNALEVNTGTTIINNTLVLTDDISTAKYELKISDGILNAKTTNPIGVTVGDRRFGGIVYHLFTTGETGYVEGESHGLVMAEYELPHGYRWGKPGVASGTTAGQTAVGTGLDNTNLLIATYSGVTDGIKYAYEVARNYKGGGYNDWFLPSLDEMNLMCPALWSGYTNICQVGEDYTENVLERGIYWTSSANDINTSMGYLFFDGAAVESGWNNGDPSWKGWGGEDMSAGSYSYRKVLPVRYF